jgi:hypothetical protein
VSAEHKIGYAYASSINAKRVGRSREGAYCLEAHGQISGYEAFSQALAAAARRGTQPARWSMDHPLNERFLTAENKAGGSGFSAIPEGQST